MRFFCFVTWFATDIMLVSFSLLAASDGAAGQAPSSASGGRAQGPHLQPDGPLPGPHRGKR